MPADEPFTQGNEPTWLGDDLSSRLSSPPNFHTPHAISGASTEHEPARTKNVDGVVVAPSTDAHPYSTAVEVPAKESNG